MIRPSFQRSDERTTAFEQRQPEFLSPLIAAGKRHRAILVVIADGAFDRFDIMLFRLDIPNNVRQIQLADSAISTAQPQQSCSYKKKSMLLFFSSGIVFEHDWHKGRSMNPLFRIANAWSQYIRFLP
jgi:hypothetical protein